MDSSISESVENSSNIEGDLDFLKFMDDEVFQDVLTHSIAAISKSHAWTRTGKDIKQLPLSLIKITVNSCLSYVDENLHSIQSRNSGVGNLPEETVWSGICPYSPSKRYSTLNKCLKVLEEIQRPNFLHKSISKSARSQIVRSFTQTIAKYIIFVSVASDMVEGHHTGFFQGEDGGDVPKVFFQR